MDEKDLEHRTYKSVKVDDPYQEKFGFPKYEVACWVDAIKESEMLKEDQKKISAVKYYLENEKEDVEETLNSVEDLEMKIEKDKKKKFGKDGKDIDTREVNNYDTNRSDFEDTDEV